MPNASIDWHKRFPIGTTMGGWLILGIEKHPKRNNTCVRVRCTSCNEFEGLRDPRVIERTDISNYCQQCAARFRSINNVNERRPDPTPEEIAAMCEEIQAEWTASERRNRNTRRAYSIPRAKVH